MASDIREFDRDVDERIYRWDMGGRVQSPQELCGDRPDLKSQVASRIHAIQSIERRLEIDDGRPPDIDEGVELLGYELEDCIGKGRFGIVYRARQSISNGPAAIKVVIDGDHRRIKREATILAEIESPYVVTIYESRELSSRLFILVMELVERGNLQDAMNAAGGKLEELQVIGWMEDVAQGMLAAANKGIIHRDLKPANILIGKGGRAKVGDFGLATGAIGGSAFTQSGAFMGTPWYMSPEQAEDPHGVDTRADIYSFGTTFYHALTGRPPFDGSSLVSILFKHLTEPLIPPLEVNPILSQPTSHLLEKCLAKSPADRFQSFEELLESLTELPTRRVPKSDTLWVYKCNARSGAEGDWNYFFDEMDGEGEWGGTWCIKNRASRKIIRERLKVGDLVLAWQSDKQAALGLCRVSELADDGQDIGIVLETVKRFEQPVKLLEWKGRSPALANGNAFRQGNAGTIFEATPAEAAEILRICGVDPAILHSGRRPPTPAMPRNWWVFHIDGKKWLSDPLAKGDTDSWPCNDKTRRNDWSLIYASKPVSALVGLLAVTSHADAYEDAGQPFLCDVKCRAVFRTPLTLEEMKKDPELGQEPLIQQEFQDGFGPPQIEAAILNRLAELIPELSRLLTRSK